MDEKVLIVFDFDHTIVDGNTDTKIQDVLKDHGIEYRLDYNAAACNPAKVALCSITNYD